VSLNFLLLFIPIYSETFYVNELHDSIREVDVVCLADFIYLPFVSSGNIVIMLLMALLVISPGLLWIIDYLVKVNKILLWIISFVLALCMGIMIITFSERLYQSTYEYSPLTTSIIAFVFWYFILSLKVFRPKLSDKHPPESNQKVL
jgi:hypothetical protein